MKKYIVFATLMLVFLAVPVQAYLQTMGVGIIQEVGSFADYDHHTQTITWSGGQDGWVMTDDMLNFVYFSDLGIPSVVVHATFSGMTDASSGGQAKASFSSGLWDLNISIDGTNVISLVGHISGKYNETEFDNSNTLLNGRAVVVIDTATFNNAYWDAAPGVQGDLSLSDPIVGMLADISLSDDVPPIFNSYLTDDYASTNVVVSFYANESVVPEPATMALLALGGLLLRKRS